MNLSCIQIFHLLLSRSAKVNYVKTKCTVDIQQIYLQKLKKPTIM